MVRLCGWCNAEIETEMLKTHLLTHVEEQKHSCVLCSQELQSVYALREHIVSLHSNEIDSHVHKDVQYLQNGTQKYVNTNIVENENIVLSENTVLNETQSNVSGDVKDIMSDNEVCIDGPLPEIPQTMRQIRKTRREFKCEECGKDYAYSCDLRRHVRLTHKGERNYVCTICEKAFSFPSELNGHMLMHNEGRAYQCDMCPLDYKQQRHLNHHKRKIHGWVKPTQEVPSVNKCPVCNKTYATKHVLNVHVKTHGERNHVCNVCNKRFLTQATLAGHMYKHGREKRFKCTLCPKEFTTNGYLKDHMNRHNNDKTYTCSICGKSYFCIGSLGLHTRTQHAERKIYKCQYCAEGFMFKRQLDIHHYEHTGIKSHLCDTCGKSFIREESLKGHRRIHTGIKPFKCSECDMSFLKAYGLKRHSLIHTKKKVQTNEDLPNLYNNLVSPDLTNKASPLITDQTNTSNHSDSEDRLDQNIPSKDNVSEEEMLRLKYDHTCNMIQGEMTGQATYQDDLPSMNTRYLNFDNRPTSSSTNEVRNRHLAMDSSEMSKFPTAFYQDCMLYNTMYQNQQ